MAIFFKKDAISWNLGQAVSEHSKDCPREDDRASLPEAGGGGVDDFDVPEADGEGVDDHADEREEVDDHCCQPRIEILVRLDCGGGQVVIVLAFYYVVPSLKPAEAYSFFL